MNKNKNSFLKLILTIFLTSFLIIISSSYVNAGYCSGTYNACPTMGAAACIESAQCAWGRYCGPSGGGGGGGGGGGEPPPVETGWKSLDAQQYTFLSNANFDAIIRSTYGSYQESFYVDPDTTPTGTVDCCTGTYTVSCDGLSEYSCIDLESSGCTWHTGCTAPAHCTSYPNTFCAGIGGGCAGTYSTKRHWSADVPFVWTAGQMYGAGAECNTCDDHNNKGYTVEIGRWIEKRCCKAALCVGGVWWCDPVDVAPAYNYYGCGGVQAASCGVGIYSSCYPTISDGYCTCPSGAEETCNGYDDNCVGGVDDGVGPTTQSCSNSNSYGICYGSQSRTCDGFSGWSGWSACSAMVPSAETCNDYDDDCDNSKDEGLALSTCGVGQCARTGSSCFASSCTPGAPVAEACNGLDDDCNGVPDNGLALSTCGVGQCARTGSSCFASSCTPGAPVAEACNGLDDDCDGVNDNGFECVLGQQGCVNLAGVCRWQDCVPTFNSNTPTCHYNGTNYICVPGNSSTVSISYSGDHCNLVDYVQVDFKGINGCKLEYSGTMTSKTTDSVGTANPRVMKYVFGGSVPDACAGIVMTDYDISLRTGNPSLSTSITRNPATISGQLSIPITLAQCGANNYIPYSTRITFAESPKFLVPDNVTAPVITSVCANYKSSIVATALPPLYVDSTKIGLSETAPCSYISETQANSYCLGLQKGYSGGKVDSTITSGNCIKCYSNTIAGVTDAGAVRIPPTSTNYVCSPISDGVCPNDFSVEKLCPLNTTTGYYSDADCGAHQFVKCLPIIDVSGASTGKNTCDPQNVTNIKTGSWCEIQGVLSSIEQVHAQCTGGAVVQDPNTGCPKCLMPNEEVVYIGIGKSVPTALDPLGLTSENMTLTIGNEFAMAGKYYACPSKKYMVIDNDGLRCEPTPIKCDEGYRTVVNGVVTSNGLGKKCDRPAIFNQTTGKWMLNTNCLYKDSGNYARYCGLNSWYKGYEIYDDRFGVVVI